VDLAPVSSSVVFRGRLNEDDVVHIMRYRGRLILPRRVRWAVAVVLTPAAGVGVWWSFLWDQPSASVFFVLVWLFFATLAFLERLQRWDTRRTFRRQQKNYLESEVILAADVITIKNANFCSSFVWKALGLVVVTPNGLMFCDVHFGTLFWLPERVLGDGARESVLGLVASKGVPTRWMS